MAKILESQAILFHVKRRDPILRQPPPERTWTSSGPRPACIEAERFVSELGFQLVADSRTVCVATLLHTRGFRRRSALTCDNSRECLYRQPQQHSGALLITEHDVDRTTTTRRFGRPAQDEYKRSRWWPSAGHQRFIPTAVTTCVTLPWAVRLGACPAVKEVPGCSMRTTICGAFPVC